MAVVSVGRGVQGVMRNEAFALCVAGSWRCGFYDAPGVVRAALACGAVAFCPLSAVSTTTAAMATAVVRWQRFAMFLISMETVHQALATDLV